METVTDAEADTPLGGDGLTVLRRIVWTDSAEVAWAELRDYLGRAGFDRVLYVATHFTGSFGLGEASDALILSNYPDAYIRAYVDGGLFRDAPVVRWASRNTGSLSFRAVAAEALAERPSDKARAVIAFNERYGISAGYAIAFPRPSPRAAFGIGLAATRLDHDGVDAVWARRGAEIETVACAAHLKIVSMPHDDQLRVLTKRQREVLELVADGKTVQDAALLIGRTAATVEKHLRLAREALNVETTAQAVLKASVQNQFFVARSGA